MKRKNISILLIVSLIMSLLPVSSVCAFTSEELDAAIGTLGDKGTYYVEGDSLPVSTVIGENTYDITYTSEPSGIISENGSITRNSSFSYVTVTPNANGVSGTPQRLLILPKSLDEEIFESFEGENFKPAEGNSLTLTAGGTYNGWELSKFKDGATISSVKDTSGNTSIKMQVTDDTAPTAPTISSEDITICFADCISTLL